jgi:hypothetical protein
MARLCRTKAQTAHYRNLGESRQASGCWSAWRRTGSKLPHASQAAALAARSSTQTARHNAARAEVFFCSDMTPPLAPFYLIGAPQETDFAAGTGGINAN